MIKAEKLSELYDAYRRKYEGFETVAGDGNINSRIMLIGEAPGKDEVKLGKPFVGMAGRNLKEFLDIIGMSREEIYITNAIKHRLSRINTETGRLVNRPASRNEIEENREYLFEEILIIRPEYIITLGNVPLRAVTGDIGVNVGSIHGELMEVIIKSSSFKVFPLYHPASIIYNRSLIPVYQNDIKKLGSLLTVS